MSFSVTVVGTPDAIKRELKRESDRLQGPSKDEFDAVKPALETILDQQVANGVVKLHANGHATFEASKKTYGQCYVHVEPIGKLVE